MDAVVVEQDVRRIWAALRFVDAAGGRAVHGPLAVQVPGARLQRNAAGLYVLMGLDAPAARRDEFVAYEAAFDPLPVPAALVLTGRVDDPLGRWLPRAFAVALPRVEARFSAQDIVLDPAPAATLLPTWAVLRVSLRRQGRPAPFAALRLRRPGGGALLGRGMSDGRGEALVVAAGVPQLEPGDGAVVVQRELAAELTASFDAAADPSVPQDPERLAARDGVSRATVPLLIASGRVQALAVDLP